MREGAKQPLAGLPTADERPFEGEVIGWLSHRLRTFGERSALLEGRREVTYGELVAIVEARFAQLLDSGIPAGAVVALRGSFSIESIGWLLALIRNRNVLVPVAVAAPDEVSWRLEAGRVQFSVACGKDGWQVESLGRGDDESPPLITLRSQKKSGLVLFSSGSTGKPKAMVHDLDRLLSAYAAKRSNHLRILLFLVADHIGGLNTLFHGFSSGAALVIPQGRDPASICHTIAEAGAHILPATPTFLNLLLMSGVSLRGDLRSLRMITYGTEPMSEALLARLRQALPWVRFVQTFGTSETGISQTVSRSSSSTFMKFDDPNHELKIVGGQLWIRSRTQILGYLGDENGGTSNGVGPDGDGWFCTGDLVETDRDGFLKIVGRQSDAINVAGQKVMPSEVEAAIMQVPEVSDCVVHGEENAITGQTVVARIVATHGSGNGSGDEAFKRRIRRYCRSHLESFKVPSRVRFAERPSISDRLKRLRPANK